jgi:HK97 family phage major capsid protein
METVGAGALAVAFGNFKQAYTIVDRLGISTLRDPYSAKPFVEFYTRKRVGGDVTNFEAIKIQKVSA